jgi:hypothetical protein
MRAVVIDPWDKRVYATDRPAFNLEEMYHVLSGPEPFRPCCDINSVRLGRDQMLWVDGEGLLIPDVPIWRLRGYGGSLAGIGLILGITEAGNNKASLLDVEHVAAMIQWTNLQTTGDLGPIESGPGYVKLGAPILKETE